MSTRIHFGLFLAAAALVISGCATTAPGSPGATGTDAPAAVAQEVPSLKVTVDCGACQVKPIVPGLIVEGYNEAAAKAGQKVSSTQEATLVIKEYTARGDAARFFAGALAGKDEIKATVSYQGKTYTVEDYYRNAWLGIDALAKKIGQMTHAELK